MSLQQGDYISLTDMLKAKDGDFFISDWLRNRNTVEFLGIWERVHNPDFNYGEFAIIRQYARGSIVMEDQRQRVGSRRPTPSSLRATAGRYGGTFAHKDIAFEFGMWISPEFKIYLIKEFQRLKDEENQRLRLDWNLQRTLAKVNYRIHTDAIKETLLPALVTGAQASMVTMPMRLTCSMSHCSEKQQGLAHPRIPTPKEIITGPGDAGTVEWS